MPAARRAFLSAAEESSMTDKPDRPADPVPGAPPVPGKTEPLPPEMPVPGTPAPEIMPTPTPHPPVPPAPSLRR
jgi:hypothetical protein